MLYNTIIFYSVFLLTYFITNIINELFGKCETIYRNFIIMYFILYYRKYNPIAYFR